MHWSQPSLIQSMSPQFWISYSQKCTTYQSSLSDQQWILTCFIS